MQTPSPARAHRFTLLTASALAFGAAFLSAPSEAEAKPIGIDLGLRVGLAAPMGSLYTNVDGVLGITIQTNAPTATYLNSLVPLQAEVGFWVHPQVLVGGYFQYGIGILHEGDIENCRNAGETCSVGDVRLGGQAQFHFTPAAFMDPWLGLGMGAEWLNQTRVEGANSDVVILGGFEFLQLQGGLDFRPAEGFRIGPYFGLTFAQFGGYQWTTRTANSTTIREEALAGNETRVHEWLMIGIKGAYTL